MNNGQQSTAAYFGKVVWNNLPYATAKVGIDKAIEWTIGLALGKLGITKYIEQRVPLPKTLNWATNYGGPLEEFQKEQGWGKLGRRARLLEKAAEEAMRDFEKKNVARLVKGLGAEARAEASADALEQIYTRLMYEHPSAKRFRTEAVRELAMVSAPVPAIVAAPATPDVIIRAAEPVPTPVIRARQVDPVIRAIDADDRIWHRSASASSPSEPTRRAPPPPQEDPRDAARRQALHDELMRVGDGKTFVVCSNGCPSRDSNWDGRAGQSLYSK
jgi:hypothetical protein